MLPSNNGRNYPQTPSRDPPPFPDYRYLTYLPRYLLLTHHSLYNSSALTDPINPLILYLPPTGIHLRASHPSIPTYLFHPTAALARINYRWNIPHSRPSTPKLLSSHPSFTIHPFPTPLHDTLHAYTYLLSSFLQRFSPPSRTPSPYPTTSITSSRQALYSPSQPPKDIQRPILIYGHYLGATLATSLALTESFASKRLPTRIAGLIARNGVYDWTGVATSPPPSPPPSTTSSSPSSAFGLDEGSREGVWDATTLYSLRERLFPAPSGAFDPFASPTLFFRTSGLPVPKEWVMSDHDVGTASPTLSSSSASTPSPSQNSNEEEAEDIFYPTPDPSLATDVNSLENAALGRRDGGELKLEVSRPAHLKYPPKDSGLKIPRSLFLYPSPTSPPSSGSRNSGNLLKTAVLSGEGRARVENEEEIGPKSQAQEMAKLMRRSVLLHEFKDRVMWDEDLDPHRAVEERVQLQEFPSHDGEERGEEERMLREWIEDTLYT